MHQPLPPDFAACLADRYRVEHQLGTGAMATVYLAQDLRHDRKVALKVLRSDISQSIGAERFLREIRLAARLSHPHILPLFDSGEANGELYYVMPNVEGMSLRDRLGQGRQLPLEEAERITREIADALDYAHRHGVVHRDVKPDNIMLHDGHAMVADFGIGKALSSVDDQVFTQTGITVGTPAYMSPEQAAGDVVDGRSDIYSLGCVLYEMLVGEPPFTGPNAQSVIAKRFVQTPTDVSALREGVSRALANVVQRALARAPADRYDTAANLVAALAHTDASRADVPEKSIAVLPFANMSADPENEYFADGITEEILNVLAQIPELRVAGRTSAFTFKGRNVDLRIIGERLNVRTVLEGSVRRMGKRVRITAQLIDVTNGYHLWSERYDREIEDVFAVQEEIASAIAERMKASFGRRNDAAVEQRATENIDAYEAYLKGRALLYRRGAAIKQGMALLQRALDLDPTYGLAWAGMADANSVLGYYGRLDPAIAGPAARHAAARALELAPDLAEAHAASAMVSLLFDWDFATAERAFQRSLEINPAYAQGAGWYYCFHVGFVRARWSEAIAGIEAVQRRDPLSAYLAGLLAVANGAGGDGDDALRWANLAMELDKESFLSQWVVAVAHYRRGDWRQAIDASDVVLAASGRQFLPMQTLVAACAEIGDVDGARAVYGELQSRSRREYVAPMTLAVAASCCGDTTAAIGHAHDAFRAHDPQICVLAQSWGQTRRLREIPEFRKILADVGLPEWRAMH